MAILPPFVGPRAGLADLRAFLRQRSPEQRIGAVLAVLATGVVLVLVFFDSKVNTAPRPTIMFVESWRADRSDAEIIAAQKKHQAAREAARKKRQAEFKKLQDQLGIE